SLMRLIQSEPEGCPFVRFPFGPYPAAMATYDSLHCGEANPEPLELRCTGEALEGDEELLRIRHVKSFPIVTNEPGLLTVDLGQAELDNRLLSLAGVFPGVAEEVVQDHPQEG